MNGRGQPEKWRIASFPNYREAKMLSLMLNILISILNITRE